MNKVELADAVATKTGMGKADAEKMLNAFVDVVTEQLKAGSEVTLTGFGTFKVSDRKAREGINPQTKAKIMIPAMTVPKFTAGKTLKEAVK